MASRCIDICILESNNVVTRLDVCDTFSDGLDNTSALVSQNDGEGAFGIFAGQGISIWESSVCILDIRREINTCVADTRVVDFNSHFMCFWRRNLYIFNGEIFTSLPGDCSL